MSMATATRSSVEARYIQFRAMQYAQRRGRPWRDIARPEQLAPPGDWRTWAYIAGRGSGKTRSGGEWVCEQIEAGMRRIALVAPTASDARDVMVEGESGILAIARERPTYEPSKRRLTWPNGAMATLYTADEPERLRGPQHDAAWCDELAAWKYPEAWDQLMFGLRLGTDPRVMVTTTPRPVKVLKEILANPHTVVTRGSTYDNLANLAPQFREQIIARYEGTRLGRQEIYGEMLEDMEGALWTWAMIDGARHPRGKPVPDLRRIVIAVDPAVTAGEDSDETGIVVAALGEDGHGYVFDDLSCKDSPDGWAQRVVKAYHDFGAHRVVAEVNNGGDLVETVLRTVDKSLSYKAIRASRGKAVRAEPVAALYEQHRVHHVGTFPALEEQMTSYVPGVSTDSPDRMDALVWALTELMVAGGPPNVRWLG